MNSLILRVAARFMLPVLLLFSIFLLVRGHNHPGGGFSGGLVAAAAFTLYAFAFGTKATWSALRVDTRRLMGAGLLVALASGTIGLVRGGALLSGRGSWISFYWVDEGTLHLGPAVFFDVGVYLVVVGVALTIILNLAEE
jgi:multicomponent Na+:H+ antiporter subunit B